MDIIDVHKYVCIHYISLAIYKIMPVILGLINLNQKVGMPVFVPQVINNITYQYSPCADWFVIFLEELSLLSNVALAFL